MILVTEHLLKVLPLLRLQAELTTNFAHGRAPGFSITHKGDQAFLR